jgi:hypothetical protein
MTVFSHVATITGTPHSEYITALDTAWIGNDRIRIIDDDSTLQVGDLSADDFIFGF